MRGKTMTKPSEQEVLKRLRSAESAISKDAEYSYYYARFVLKGRFEKGENAISKDADYSCSYARYVLKGKFEKGEDIISKNAEYSDLYKEYVYDAKKELEKEFKKLRDSIKVNYLYGIEV